MENMLNSSILAISETFLIYSLISSLAQGLGFDSTRELSSAKQDPSLRLIMQKSFNLLALKSLWRGPIHDIPNFIQGNKQVKSVKKP